MQEGHALKREPTCHGTFFSVHFLTIFLKKQGLKKWGQEVCLQKKGCCNDQMDLRYGRMWIVHKPTIIKNDGCRVNTNKGYIIPRWNTKQ